MRLLWQSVSVLSTAALLLVLRQLEPRFWFIDDKRNQYLPVARDIGRRLRAGEFPTIDPNLGTGGNFALDLQYGLYEPVHLLTAVFLAYVDNFALAGFLWAAAYLLIFALGTTCLTLRLGAAGLWAVAAGVSASTSGYVLYWLAPNWIPGLLSLAWLPWLWWAWSGRLSPLRCLAVAVFTYLVIAGGWPATWLMFAALGIGLLVEEMVLRDRDAPRRSSLAPLAIRSAAVIAGVIPAIITVLPLMRATGYTARNDEIHNSNFLVPNLADLLAFASPTLHGEITGYWGSTIMSPIYFAAWFGLPVLWLVTWSRQRVMVRGVISAALAGLIMAALTQAPSDLGPLRNPFRGLAGFQFFLIVAVVMLACAGALVVNRNRVAGLTASLLALGWLTWARDPLDSNGWTGVLIVAALAAALVVAARIAASAAGLVALVGTGVAAVVAFQLSPVDVDPLRPVTDTVGSVSITEPDWPVFASYPRTEPVVMQRWFADGVGRGFERLSADVRLAPGYSSIRQVGFEERFCIKSSHGYTCDAAARRLLEAEPQTDRPWIDLLGYRTVVLTGEKRQRQWNRAAGPEWERVDKGTDFFKYQRREAPVVAGRITHVEGEADIRELDVNNATQSYKVASPSGATLVFSDLYWPGYTATLDGEPLKVSSLSETLLAVELPPGATGELTVHYAPVTGGELAGLTAGGMGVAGVSMVMAWLWRRRLTTDLSETEAARAASASDKSVGVDGDRDEGEPDDGKPLQDPV